MEAATAEENRKVFVVVPAEPRAGRSTLSWALVNLCGGGGATTVVVTHVHVPPQMIPVSTCSPRALHPTCVRVSGRPLHRRPTLTFSFLLTDLSGSQIPRQQAAPGASELVQNDGAREGGQDAGRVRPSVLENEGAISFLLVETFPF
jgi:hypothetical protein